MSSGQWFLIAGLVLTIAGALVLAWFDMRGSRTTNFEEARLGFPRREARLGFPLIAAGAALQIVGVLLS